MSVTKQWVSGGAYNWRDSIAYAAPKRTGLLNWIIDTLLFI